MSTNIQHLREKNNFTQSELAEKSGLSLRTIQRIEAGHVLKGFTLKAISAAFGVAPETLFEQQEKHNIDRTKLINLSVIMGLIIPFGGIIFPLLLTKKTIDKKNKELGKSIVSVQIILTVMLSIALIVCPFVHKRFSINFPLFLIPLLLFILVELLVIIINGINLNKYNDLHKALKINYL